MAENNVPAEALVLANVAIRADTEWRDNTSKRAREFVGTRGEFVAAAIDRHMVHEANLKDGYRLMRPGQVTTVHAGTKWDSLYRITTEPQGDKQCKSI